MSGGKREASGPLVTTSDEDEPNEDLGNTPSSNPEVTESEDSEIIKTTKSQDFSLTDHDYENVSSPGHDYENVSSPGNSSTASGPIYVRQPGFTQHAHEVIVSRPKIKKKKTNSQFLAIRENGSIRRREPTPPKTKPRREPLPMRQRALPQSFWQQPNVPHTVSPGGATYPVLPPLCTREGEDVMRDIRPVTPPGEKEKSKHIYKRETKITLGNTDLLLKLFDGVEANDSTAKKNPINQLKRGRPRKVVPCSNKTFLSGEDPYLVENVTEKFFPQLSLEHSKTQMSGHSMLHLVTLKEGEKSVTLPSLSVEQNYPQMLSELVTHI